MRPVAGSEGGRLEWLVRRSEGDLPRGAARGRFPDFVQPEMAALPGPGRPSLISSAEGPLRELLLTIPSSSVGRPQDEAIFRDLIGKLPSDTALLVLTHASTLAQVEAWPELVARTVTVLEIPDHLAFSIWAEDAYAAARDAEDGTRYLVEPHEFLRYADSLTADWVAAGTAIRNSPSPLYFQGGNLLVGDDFFLIGADYPDRTLGYVPGVIRPDADEDDETLVRRLYREYLDRDREIHYVTAGGGLPEESYVLGRFEDDIWVEHRYVGNGRGTVQPLFHIDMFVSLAGRAGGAYRVLVGDPRAAARILGLDLPPHAMADAFDAVAAQLADLGFEVHRNPLPLTGYWDTLPVSRFARRDPDLYSELVDLGLERVDLFTWYFATGNNALVQRSDEAGDAVWMPTYGPRFAATDDRNELIWRELGFEVHRLGDYHGLAGALGAVHCITKYLDRG